MGPLVTPFSSLTIITQLVNQMKHPSLWLPSSLHILTIYINDNWNYFQKYITHISKNSVLSKISEVNCSQQLINKNLKSIFATLGGNLSLFSTITFWFLWTCLRLCGAFRPNLIDHMRAIISQMHAGGHLFGGVIWGWEVGNNGFSFVRSMVGLDFQTFSCMGILNWWVDRGSLENFINRWGSR